MKFFFILFAAATLAMSTVVLKPGDKAPDFTTIATDGSHISLHQFKGTSNVVLYFYPEDMTSGCTIEACNFRDSHDRFAATHTVVLGVSLDDQAKHQVFTQKDNLNFPLLVDSDSTICRAYGVPINSARHHAARWTFLIDKNGTVVQTYHDVDPRTHSEQLLKDIAQIK